MTDSPRHAGIKKEKWYETVWFGLVLILGVMVGFWALFIWNQ
jgi:hypothetical protein